MDASPSHHLLAADLNQVKELVSRSHRPERMSLLSSAADAKVPREELMARGREDGSAKQKEYQKEKRVESEAMPSQIPSQPSGGFDFYI